MQESERDRIERVFRSMTPDELRFAYNMTSHLFTDDEKKSFLEASAALRSAVEMADQPDTKDKNDNENDQEEKEEDTFPELRLVRALVSLGVHPTVDPSTTAKPHSVVSVLKKYESLVFKSLRVDIYDVKRGGVQNGVELMFCTQEEAEEQDNQCLAVICKKQTNC